MFLICKVGGTSVLSSSVFSLLTCTGNSLMPDFGAFWKRKFRSLLGVTWISLGQVLPLGMCWCLGSPMAAVLNLLSLVFWFQLVIMKWVPPHRSLWPTNQRRTLLGWVLSSSLQNCFTCVSFYWWLSIYIPVLSWDFCKKKISPFMSQDNNQKDFVACVSQIKYWHEPSDPLGSAV